ncbi:alpha-ketoglutarate-dependent dioxygenase AlkB, partial [Klebsiella pneumoniae]|uniref:alpha-ketoglutarate-dependent dioxygenase AlkB n=1 Tax=Klebsiella pneumoniae TaxID=573 RepID=UPI0024DE4697
EAFKMIAQTANSTVSEFPQINPDICIMNYYTNSGKLGLHQDKDESKSSPSQGLIFISISIGDTAEFLFSDTSDKDKAT